MSYNGQFWFVYIISWNKVPTVKHFVSLERVFTKDFPDSTCFVADYYLKPATGGFYNDDAFKYDESVYINWLQPRKGKTYSRVYGEQNISSVTDLLSGYNGREFLGECDKRNMKFSDFDYGFILTHLYDDYTYERNEVRSFVYALDTLVDGECLKSINWSRSNANVKGLEVLNRNKFLNDPVIRIDSTQYSRQYTNILFTDKEINYPLRRGRYSLTGFGFLNKLYKLLSLHDITKTNYVITLFQEGLDSVNYTIKFKEGVAFSEMNIQPSQKDMNSISFGVSCKERYAFNNIKFYVEFLESNNIQTIRVGILMALLALPFGLLIKNIWSLLTQAKQAGKNNTVPLIEVNNNAKGAS